MAAIASSIETLGRISSSSLKGYRRSGQMRECDYIQLQTILGGFFGLHLDRDVFGLGERLSERQELASDVAY